MCADAGASTILAMDVDDQRLRTARKFGATDVVKTSANAGSLDSSLAMLPDSRRIAVAFDFSGAPDAVELAIESLAVGGVAVLIGSTYPAPPIHLNAERIVRNLLTIRGLHNYNDGDLVTAVEFVEQSHARWPFADLVNARFRLDEAEAAFAHAISSGIHRVGIDLLDRPLP
jgi:alcohol dehydrogenase